MQYVIIGLDKGFIKSYELDTGRPDASYQAHHERTDIVQLHMLKK